MVIYNGKGDTPMRIGIIGAADVGSSLGKGWAQKGHAVMLSSREPDGERMRGVLAEIGHGAQAGTVDQTVDFGEVVVIAMRWDYLKDTLPGGSSWAGKTVIDATNRFAPAASGKSAAEDLAAMLPGAHVVKAFNTIGAEHMPHGQINGEQLSMFIAGDDASAKATVSRLTEDLGFSVVDAGGLDRARMLENLAELWVALVRSGRGRNFGFRLVQG